MTTEVEKHRYRATRRITLLTAFVNAVLSILKVSVGLIGHSHALFADGIHSLADLLSDGMVLCAARYGSIAADHNHPYGHGKIETVGTTLLSVLLMAVGIGIAVDAVQFFWHPNPETPIQLVLLIAAISVLANELLFQYSRRIALEIRSDLVLANAWHHRSDALSSVVVLIGVSGAMFGFHYLDALAAIVVSFMIMKMAWGLVWSSLQELIDTAVDDKTLAQIKDSIATVKGVIQLHQLRTRLMRGHILVDVHVIVAEKLSVSEGHHIAQQVRLALERDVRDVVDVTVHIDPEDDEIAPPSQQLPTREVLQSALKPLWESCTGYKQIQTMTLHYLDGKLQIDLTFPLSLLCETVTAEDMQCEYRKASLDCKDLSEVRLYFH